MQGRLTANGDTVSDLLPVSVVWRTVVVVVSGTMFLWKWVCFDDKVLLDRRIYELGIGSDNFYKFILFVCPTRYIRSASGFIPEVKLSLLTSTALCLRRGTVHARCCIM